MYKPRTVSGKADWLDPDSIKIYTISADGQEVDTPTFYSRLKEVKSEIGVDWARTAAFVIFHKGAGINYLVLAWWDNGNELFTSVSAYVEGQWVTNPREHSFCLYDMEVMWRERTIYIETIDCAEPSLERYRASR